MAKKKWIKGAIKHPGAMTDAAKSEGVSNSEYIQEHKHDSGKSGQRARFAENAKHFKHKSGKELAHSMYGKK